MIAQLLNQDFVAQCVGLAEMKLNQTLGDRHRRGGGPSKLDQFDTADLEEIAELLRERGAFPAPGADGDPPKDDFVYIPRDALTSILQSVIEEYVDEHEPSEIVDEAPPDDRRAGAPPLITGKQLRDVPLELRGAGRRLWKPFEVSRPKIFSDPGWLVSGLVIAWHHFKKMAAFKEPGQLLPLSDNARLLLVGDWGSGLKRAQNVATQMRRELEEGQRAGLEQHVIHLGDVYYTGGRREYERRFLSHWPVDPDEDIASYTLMGNHDMYRGGHAYFDSCLGDRRFAAQQGSSVFGLRGTRWQFLALDSAYEDEGLYGDQADWVKQQLPAEDDDRLRTALMSHHQLYSAYEPGSKILGRKIEPILATKRVDAWFWAHEHRCLVYGPDRNLRFASCVGHGGIPEYLIATGDDPYPSPLVYDYRRIEGDGSPPWNTFGFAVIDLRNATLQIRYIDEYGSIHHQTTVS